MPIALVQIKQELYPGLCNLQGRYGLIGCDAWGNPLYQVIPRTTPLLPTPHIWIPKLTLPQAALAGAAAALITNPPITRRFWKGWLA